MFYLLMPFNLHSQVIKCCFYDHIISILSWNHEWHFCLWEFLTNHVWHFLFLRYFFSTIVQSFDFVDIVFNKNKNLLIFCKQKVLKKKLKKIIGRLNIPCLYKVVLIINVTSVIQKIIKFYVNIYTVESVQSDHQVTREKCWIIQDVKILRFYFS